MNQRQQAYELLLKVFKEKAYLNLELRQQDLTPFVSKLVHTVIDQYELLAFQLKPFLSKPIPFDVELILVMVVAQYHFMDQVPPYAMVNEAVQLTKKRYKGLSGLVNAVSKKLLTQPLLIPQQEEIEDLAIVFSHPIWMVRLLVKQYGLSVAKQILEHNNQPRPLDIRIHPQRVVQEELLELPFIQLQEGYLCAQAELFKSTLLQEGKVVIQDRNSQALVNGLNLEGIETILDCCSGPGTKTVQLALLYPEASITALELHEHRLELVKQLCERWGVNSVSYQVADACSYQMDKQVDLVFCDVPCSGLGVIGRKGDLKRNIQPENLDELQNIQAAILDNMARFVKPQGYLVYATCTLNKKENEKQIESFLTRHKEFKLINQETIMGYQNNGDSFYWALLSNQQ